MPRLANPQYLRQCHVLRIQWIRDEGLFGFLTPAEQSDLHTYFVPAENLDKVAQLARRKHVTRLDPSLPHRAGRAMGQLKRLVESIELADGAQVRIVTSLGAQGIFRPQPNIDLLARTFIHIARDLETKKRTAEQERQDEAA